MSIETKRIYEVTCIGIIKPYLKLLIETAEEVKLFDMTLRKVHEEEGESYRGIEVEVVDYNKDMELYKIPVPDFSMANFPDLPYN